jgi:hypothetical protein
VRRRRPRPWRRGLAALAALGVAMVLTGCSGLPCRLGAPAEFVSLGKNPFAAAQPTAVGRYLHTLEGWQGELYMGYGDYDENTGPIEVSAYNPRWSSYGTKLRFPTEAIELFRPIGDRLYAPAIDPRGDGPSAAVAVGEPDGRWSNNKNVWMTHVFDVATFDGTDLWLVGSRKTQAIAVRTRDGGRTWETALALEPRGADGDFARFHFVFVHGGRLYVQAQDRRGGMFPRSNVFDGNGWTDGPNLRPIPNTGAKPLAVAGETVYFGARGVMAFDGRAVRLARPPQTRIHDLVVTDGILYVLDGREVLGTQDLAWWIPVATAPAGTTSIGVLDGYLYAGTVESELFRYCRPVRPLR